MFAFAHSSFRWSRFVRTIVLGFEELGDMAAEKSEGYQQRQRVASCRKPLKSVAFIPHRTSVCLRFTSIGGIRNSTNMNAVRGGLRELDD